MCYRGTPKILRHRAAKYIDEECRLSGSASEDESSEEDVLLSGSFINDGPYTQHDSSQGSFLHHDIDRGIMNNSTDGLFDIRFGNRRILLPNLERALNTASGNDCTAITESDRGLTSSNRSVNSTGPTRGFLTSFMSQDVESSDEW